MMNIYETKLKTIVKQNPILRSMALRIINKQLYNKVHKKIKGKNNKIQYNIYSVLNDVEFNINGNNNQIDIGDNCYLYNVKFYIRGNNHKISIGNNVLFHHGSSIWFEDKCGSLAIGDNTTFEDVHIAVTEPNSTVRIGNDCMFAYDIDIRTGDSHSIIDLKTNKRTNFAKNVSFGNHIWVAAHCLILKGCSIPDGCVVATGSVLTKSIESTDTVVAGNPAKIVKNGISWERERIYNQIASTEFSLPTL